MAMPINVRNGAGLLTAMGLVFGVVGLVTLYFALDTVLVWQRMSRWDAVPAELRNVRLESHRSNKSTTYKVAADYHYRYDGREYWSSRVAISSAADNIGDFQQRLYAELHAAQERNRPVTAYVNPANPSEAALNRDVRAPLLIFQLAFSLIFAGTGFGLATAARRGARQVAAERALRLRFPDEPWRWRPEWAEGRVRADNRARAFTAIGIAAVWNLVAIPAALFVPRDAGAVGLVVMVFPLVGAALAVSAVRAWLQWRRFGAATLELVRTPVPLGGHLAGSIRVDALVPVTRAFRLELCCSEQRRSGSKGQTSERLLWQAAATVQRDRCRLGPDRTSIPVDIAVPANQPATATMNEDSSGIRWYLDVTGECPGPDFWSRFELPVFAVSGSEAPAPAAEVAPDAAHRPDRRQLADVGIDYSTLPGGGEQWIFKRGQHAGAAAGLTVFTLLWTAVSAFLFTIEAPLPIPLAFVAFDLVLIWWALSLWLTEYRVTLDHGVLTLTKRTLASSAPVEIPLQWIRGVSTKRGMQAGSKLYYDLQIETVDRVYTAASALDDYTVATWLASYWRTGGNAAQTPAR